MKAAFHTLGCKVNQYETEAMASSFMAKGYEVVDEKEFADVYIVNTCTVTAIADRKSRQYIRRMKKVNPDSVVVVTGCYAQIKPEEVAALEEADIVTGTNEKNALTDYVAEYMENGLKQVHVKGYEELDEYDDAGMVISSENRTRAYIKIQEGCNRFCSYCVIPYARGKVRSRDEDGIMNEARHLIEAGYKELVLTGINTALYGMEEGSIREVNGTDGRLYGVEKVIAELDKIPGNFRIRLSSLEPAVINAAYVMRLMKYDKLCHHMHLSAQSGSDRVLRAMNRPYDRREYLDIVKALRSFDPYYGISTDIITGFPGEDEEDFQESRRLVEECDFCRTHVFKYSKRPLTRAASMADQVPPAEKNRRSDMLREDGELSSVRFLKRNRGRVETVLTEEMDAEDNTISGYSGNYIKVYITLGSNVDGTDMLNKLIRVKLTDVYADGMTGIIIE